MKHIARFCAASLTANSDRNVRCAEQKCEENPTRPPAPAGDLIAKNPKSDAMSFLVLKIDGGGSGPPSTPSLIEGRGVRNQNPIPKQLRGVRVLTVVNIQPSGKRCLMFPHPEEPDDAVRPGERI